MSLASMVAEAEKRARLRDYQREVDLLAIERELQKAEESGLMLVRTQRKNRAVFTQIITENTNYLLERQYMTTAEKSFLYDLANFVEMHSNAIVKPDGTGKYMTITDLAKALHYSVRHVRTLTNRLIEKGIIYEFVDTQSLKKYGRVVEERPLFLNPEIIFRGDKNRINATLCRLVMNADHLEKAKMYLPLKVWIGHNEEYGKLYRRNTWLKKKRGEK